MSLRKTLETEPISYIHDRFHEWYSHFLQGACGDMHEDLYDDTLNRCLAIWLRNEGEPKRIPHEIHACMLMDSWHYPWQHPSWECWDIKTGERKSWTLSMVTGVLWSLSWFHIVMTEYVAVDRWNRFFRKAAGDANIYYSDEAMGTNGVFRAGSFWQGDWAPKAPFALDIDDGDYLVAGCWNDPNNADLYFGPYCHAWRASTGAKLRSFTTISTILDIFPEDGPRVWVLNRGGFLQLVDINLGQTIALARVDFQPNTTEARGVYDRFGKKIYILEKTPDDGNLATSCVRGYWATELPKRIMDPVMLRRQVKGRQVPVLTRIVGDLTTPMAGRRITYTEDSPGSLLGADAWTDENGYTLAYLSADAPGPGTVTVTAEV